MTTGRINQVTKSDTIIVVIVLSWIFLKPLMSLMLLAYMTCACVNMYTLIRYNTHLLMRYDGHIA
jgi:hypothetical protein